MSGRSAYVRKRGQAKSDKAATSSHPIGPRNDPERDVDSAGVGTTNARFETLIGRNGLTVLGNRSSGSQSGSSTDGIREDGLAYTRQRSRPETGIEKSGLRSALDKTSDEVRKGLAKAFTFKKKTRIGDDAATAFDLRPPSSATVRPTAGAGLYHLDVEHEGDISPVRFRGVPQNRGYWQDDAGGVALPPPSSKLPPLPVTPSIKRWIGSGRPVQRWNKLRKDPELWDPNGDVLVFLGQKGQSPRTNPSFRLSSHVVEATESRHLIMLLRQGLVEEDIQVPISPVGSAPLLQPSGSHGQRHLRPGDYGRGGQVTPPVSEHDSLHEAEGEISYEMYFPAPPNLTALDQLRHHITTRNVFALLYHASLVGLSLYQALTDLHARLESYMPREADNLATIVRYLSARGIDDVRNDAETAVSMLAWSEAREVRWEEGWRESFVHCAGMYPRLESCADFRHVTPITRALLERACLETQLRVQAAEEPLAAFHFSDMWPAAVSVAARASGPVVEAPAKAAADSLQRFFVQYYMHEFGSWPPPAHDGEDDIWLTRTVAQSLQRDFGALYDYLVNRDIVWDESETRPSRKWMMVSESGNRAFEADTPHLPMTDMLIEFDNKHRFPHIPYPYPLLPESFPLPSSNNESKSSVGTNGGGRTRPVERRIQLAYTEATNICLLGPGFAHSNLVDAFGKFEKADHAGEADPATARRGRWVLIYGILQTLASVSVDAPNVRYKDGVPYHLSPRLKGARFPPWKAGPDSYEATHEQSHCWTVPATWADAGSTSGALGEEVAQGDAYGENYDSYRLDGALPYQHHNHSSHNSLVVMQTAVPTITPRPLRPVTRSSSSSATTTTTTTTTSTTNSTAGGPYHPNPPFSPLSAAASVRSHCSERDMGMPMGPRSSSGVSSPPPFLSSSPLQSRRGLAAARRSAAAGVPVVEERERERERKWERGMEREWGGQTAGRMAYDQAVSSFAGARARPEGRLGGAAVVGDERGGFWELDEVVDGMGMLDVEGQSFVMEDSGRAGERRREGGLQRRTGGRRGLPRPLLSGGGSEESETDAERERVGVVIRDFDELGEAN